MEYIVVSLCSCSANVGDVVGKLVGDLLGDVDGYFVCFDGATVVGTEDVISEVVGTDVGANKLLAQMSLAQMWVPMWVLLMDRQCTFVDSEET